MEANTKHDRETEFFARCDHASLLHAVVMHQSAVVGVVGVFGEYPLHDGVRDVARTVLDVIGEDHPAFADGKLMRDKGFFTKLRQRIRMNGAPTQNEYDACIKMFQRALDRAEKNG